jgi:hypothetical protein
MDVLTKYRIKRRIQFDDNVRIHDLDSEAAAGPTQIIAVKKIGFSVLAEREGQRLAALCVGMSNGNGSAPPGERRYRPKRSFREFQQRAGRGP